MNSELTPRIGTFLILIGLGLLVLFVLSILGKNFNILFLLACVPALAFGYLLRRKAKPPASSARFASIRNAQERSKKRREEKKNQQQKKK